MSVKEFIDYLTRFKLALVAEDDKLVLKGNKSKSFGPQEIEFLDVIHNSGQDLLTLINDVLDLAKVESRSFLTSPSALSS